MIDIFKNGTSGARWDIETEKRFRPLARGKFLEPFGFKVYSQNDEDGIISEIFSRIGTTDKRFIEFGVDGLESNSHYLLLKGWSGLWLEACADYCIQTENKFRPAISSGQLKLLNTFVTRENINDIFTEQGFTGSIDLLSIDIDGNDYHIWKAIEVVDPRVVIIEYNAKFPPECSWYMPYNEYHAWDGSDRQGASLKALEILGREKGYQLVGTNLNGINAFFVKSELTKNKFPLPATAENLYNPMRISYLKYHSGHPSNVYLGSHTEGIAGEFEYLPESQQFVTGYGFWDDRKNYDSLQYIQWMKHLSAKIFVKIPQDITYLSAVEIEYLNYSSQETTLVISCANNALESKQSFVLESTIGKDSASLQYHLELPQAIEYLELDLEISDLFVPNDTLHNGDFRKLGFGIKAVTTK